MDAITLLKEDHRTAEKWFKDFERAGDSAAATKGKIARRIIKELSVHAAIEEQVFYPAIRREVEGVADTVLESLEEHHVAKWLLSELDGMDPGNERFDAKVTVLIESVRHHIKEEEGSLFPSVRAALGRKRLGEIGLELESAKKRAPVRPHPRSPDTPPGNLIVGAIGGVLDKVRSGGT